MAYKANTIEELLAIMERVQGDKTLTQFAEELDVSKQYLSNVFNRHKEPSERLLGKLGVRSADRVCAVANRKPRGKEKMSGDKSESSATGGKQRVLVNVILDKSGSMGTKVQDVIGGFNLYLDELAKERTVEYGLTLTLFDTLAAMRYKCAPLADVAKLDQWSYRPEGNTALFDAIGNTVQTVSTDGFDKVITVIMTDGEENSSREWSLAGIRDLIRAKENEGNWTFVFLGANMDAFAQGGKLGIPARNAQIFDPENYVGAYANLSKRTNAVSAALEKASRDFFKSEAGDKKPS